MSFYLSLGGKDAELSLAELRDALFSALDKLGQRRNVLAVPPDFTRVHSCAGPLTRMAAEHYGPALTSILPALGTHAAMTESEIAEMFGDLPRTLFEVHNWRHGVTALGEVPASFIREQSEGKLEFSWPVEVNRRIASGQHDLVLSIGQVVPHEVIGMANYNKNILVGTGGAGGIGRSHWLGAVYGMERIMGRADTPVRRVFNYASRHFLGAIPIVYVLTVVGRNAEGKLVVRGLFVGDDQECFMEAARLSLEVNFQMLDEPIRKAVVYLDPAEFKSTWLGNKAIYRLRMALADGAELVILAPGVRAFGEDETIDRLIRKYGYRGTAATLEAVQNNQDLADSLGAAAHLIHGSAEGRFRVVYSPGKLTRKEVESVGFGYASRKETAALYDPAKLRDGFNTVGGERVFYCSNPALGLWALRERFAQE
jgi:nickel-dependent lactate racemase